MGEKSGIYVGHRKFGAGKPVNALPPGLPGGGVEMENKKKKKKDNRRSE